eukprot:7048647-Lingulodinium_polyedra.AAC.1
MEEAGVQGDAHWRHRLEDQGVLTKQLGEELSSSALSLCNRTEAQVELFAPGAHLQRDRHAAVGDLHLPALR